MGIITRPEKKFSNPGSNQYAPIVEGIASIPRAEEWNEDLDTIYQEINGRISGENLKDKGLDVGSAKFTGTLATDNGGVGVTTGARFIAGTTVNQAYIAGRTAYVSLLKSHTETVDETSMQVVLPFNCRVRNLYVVTKDAQSATGSLVIRIRKNEANTPIVVTIAAGGAAQTASDTTNSDYFSVGDKIAVSLTNNATATSALVSGLSCEILPL